MIRLCTLESWGSGFLGPIEEVPLSMHGFWNFEAYSEQPDMSTREDLGGREWMFYQPAKLKGVTPGFIPMGEKEFP